MYPTVPEIFKQSHNGMKLSGYSIPEGPTVSVWCLSIIHNTCTLVP